MLLLQLKPFNLLLVMGDDLPIFVFKKDGIRKDCPEKSSALFVAGWGAEVELGKKGGRILFLFVEQLPEFI